MLMEIPVYLFTGFLGSGKTTFIQEALGAKDFNEGERTLLLLCEEGEVEYDPSGFYNDAVYPERIRKESDLTPELLTDLLFRHKTNRVIIEWNGMWDLNTLYDALPPMWTIYQQMMLAEAPTFLMYNTNIRQQTFEQLKGAEMVVFNRCRHEKTFEKWQLEVHKICRVANRRSQIMYEFGPDDLIMDTIPDPLPYDMTKPQISIEDCDYAEWYRDINENQDDYEGKEIIIKGRVVVGGDLPPEKFIFGRHVMTCCEADIQFAGLLCKTDPERRALLTNGQWAEIRAKVKNEYDPVYEETGPVLYCSEVSDEEPCVPEVATF